MISFWGLRVEVPTDLILLSDDILNQREQSVNVRLLTRMELLMRQWAFHGLRERLSNFLYVLMVKKVLQVWRSRKEITLLFCVSLYLCYYLDHSVCCNVLQLLLRRRGLWGRHSTSLTLLGCFSFAAFLSRPSVSEDAHNEQIDGKHDDRTLNSNHHLLPGKLYVACKAI